MMNLGAEWVRRFQYLGWGALVGLVVVVIIHYLDWFSALLLGMLIGAALGGAFALLMRRWKDAETRALTKPHTEPEAKPETAVGADPSVVGQK